VNCAAVWKAKQLEKVTAADVRAHWEVNTLGTFLCAQHAGLAMVRQAEGGAIVNLGDWAAARPYRHYSAYFPSKGAVPTPTRCLAVELGTRNPRVRVNCIMPGPVLLPRDLPEAERRQAIEGTIVKREGKAENIAQAVLAVPVMAMTCKQALVPPALVPTRETDQPAMAILKKERRNELWLT
jgi:pteridine reductase